MPKNFTVRLRDDVAADAEALAGVEGNSLDETVKQALIEAVAITPASGARGVRPTGSVRSER